MTKPDYALLIGVVLSLILFVWKTAHPRIVQVTKDPELNMFLNTDVYRKPNCTQILELRPDNCIFFGNAESSTSQRRGVRLASLWWGNTVGRRFSATG